MDESSLTAVCICMGPLPAGKERSVKHAGISVGWGHTSCSKTSDGNARSIFDSSVMAAKLSPFGGTELKVLIVYNASLNTTLHICKNP